jgi:hypothetical protein
MSANAVSNDNLKNHRADNGTTGFTPVVKYEYDATAKEVDITDESLFPSGVSLKKVAIRIHDKFGGEKRGTLTPTGDSGFGDSVTVDVATLDASKGLDITATVIADDDKLVADGSAHNIGAAGSLSSWDAQKNA